MNRAAKLAASALLVCVGCGARTSLPPGPEPETPFLWSARFGGEGEDAATALAVDAEGGVVVTGYVSSPVDFGTGPVGADSDGEHQIFAARFDADGRASWSRVFGRGEGLSVALAPGGDVLLTGFFVERADFGGGTLSALPPPRNYPGQDAFIARLDADGGHVWSRSMGDVAFEDQESVDSERGDSVALDPDGRVLVTGYFDGQVDFGNGTLTSEGRRHTFVQKLEASGQPLWTIRAGRTDVADKFSIASDPDGDVVLGGSFRSRWRVGEVDFETAGVSDLVIEKLSPDGDRLWSRTYGSRSWDTLGGLLVDASGEIALIGTYEADLAFGDVLLGAANANKDVFTARLDASGAPLSAARAGGGRDDEGRAIARGRGGHLAMTGNFEERLDYAGPPITSQGNYDVFVLDQDEASGSTKARGFGGDRDQFGTGIGVDTHGNVLVAGFFGGTVDFGEGVLPSAGAEDIFLAKLAP